jgi:hypothetical protein
MPYASPELNPSTSVGTFTVRDEAGTGEYLPRLQLTTGQFGNNDATVEEAEVLFQKILDAIASNPDLTVFEASRVYRVDQIVTPT